MRPPKAARRTRHRRFPVVGTVLAVAEEGDAVLAVAEEEAMEEEATAEEATGAGNIELADF